MQGKRILISGNIRGVGKELALRLEREGAKLVVFCASDSDIEDNYDNIFVYKIVFNDADALCGNFERALMVYGDFDCIINIATVDSFKPIAEMETYQYSEIINNNLRSQFVLSREYARLLRDNKRRGGNVLNIVCTSGIPPKSGAEGYYSVKGGVKALTKALAGSFEEYGVTTNCIIVENTDSCRDTNYEEIIDACLFVLSSDSIISGQTLEFRA